MSRYNTGNPVGSADPRDRDDNSKNLDVAVNTTQDRWTDRLGNERVSLAGAVDPSGFAQSALNDANRAEAAANAAFVNADVYEDVAAGLAGTSDGEQFQVVEGVEVVRYLNDDESAVEVARYPAAEFVNLAFDAAAKPAESPAEFHVGDGGPSYSIIGSSGVSFFSVDQDGVASLPFMAEFHTEDGQPSFCWTDRGNVVFYALDELGVNMVGGGQSGGLPTSPEGVPAGRLYSEEGAARVQRDRSSLYELNPSAFPEHVDIYQAFDALVDEFGDYVTKNKEGEDELGNEIFSYRFTPPQLQLSGGMASTAISLPKILVVGGVHAGTEKRQVLGNLIFANDMCRSWLEDERLSHLRFQSEVVILPCSVPSAYDLGTRKNHNGVDVNRNFPINWENGGSSDPSSGNYRGPAEASELETNVIMDFLQDHSDAICAVDHHGFTIAGIEQRAWYGASTPESAGVGLYVSNQINSIIRRDYTSIPNDDSPSRVRFSINANATCGQYFQLELGIPGLLIESPRITWDTPFNMNRFTQDVLLYSLLGFLSRELGRRVDKYDIF